MTVKVIAIKPIHKTAPGGTLELADNVAKVLVLLGNAKYAEGEETKPAPAPVSQPRPRGRPRGTGRTIGAVTKQNVRSDSAE